MIDNFVADSSDKNVSIFLIFLILYKNSDENHPLTINAINELLESKYQGIHLDRKTLGKKLNTLMSILNDEEDFPFSIAKIPNKGWCINERPFIDEQLIFLMDSIYSNKSISFAEANDLCDSINRCLSKYQVKEKYCDYKSSDINNGNSEGVLYNIAIIREAIKLKKNISFYEIEYRGWKKIIQKNLTIVTPFYLFNKEGTYYLLATELYNMPNYNLSSSRCFKVENLSNLKFNNDTKPIEIEKTIFHGNFSLVDYVNNQLIMSDGTIMYKDVKYECAMFKGSFFYFHMNRKFISKFVKYKKSNFKIEKQDIKNDTIYFTVKANQAFLLNFAIEYADEFELIEPKTLRERVIMKLYDYITGPYDIVNNVDCIQMEKEKETFDYFINSANEVYYRLFDKKRKYNSQEDCSFLKIINIVKDLYSLIQKENKTVYNDFINSLKFFLAQYLYVKEKILSERNCAYSFLCNYLLADFYYPILKNSFCIDKENIDVERALNHLNSSMEFYNDKTYDLLKDELELLHIDKEDLNPEKVIKKITANTK